MRKRTRDPRKQALARIRARLEARGWPRLEMTAILAATGAAGFLFSFTALHVGLRSMPLRYGLAVAVGYAVFLLGLKLWLVRQRHREARTLKEASGDWLGGLPSGGGGGGGAAPAPAEFGGGGGFGGGGAGGSWSAGEAQMAVVPAPVPAEPAHVGLGGGHGGSGVAHGGGSGAVARGGGPGGGGGGFDFDLDEGLAVVFLVLAVLAAVAASLYVIWVAPSFLAELLLDSALVGGLYRRTRGIEHHDWVFDALRRTLIPLLLTLVLFVLAGVFMHRAAPEATSIGGFIAHVTR